MSQGPQEQDQTLKRKLQVHETTLSLFAYVLWFVGAAE